MSRTNDSAAYAYIKTEELKAKLLNLTLDNLILAKSFENPDMIQTFGSLYVTRKELLQIEIEKIFNSILTLGQLSPSGMY